MARHYSSLLGAARLRLASFLGAQPNHLAWLSNATAGVNAVLRSLDWQAGDEILVTDHTYNACHNVATYLCQTRGVRVVKVAVPFPNFAPEEMVASIVDAVGERTKLAMVDHVTSPTALVFPVAEIAEALAARGVKVLVDGAHAPGMLDLNLENLGHRGVTFYTGNLHKWCCSPKGAAFLWVGEENQPGLHPTVISHGFNSTATGRSRFLEEFDWGGTCDPTAWLAAPRALELLGGLLSGGWPELRASCRAVLLQGRRIVAEALPPQPLADEQSLGQIATLQLPRVEPNELYRELYDEFGIDSMVTIWNGRPLLRLSAAPYNTVSDYHTLAAALKEISARRTWSGLAKES
jgi:isopenicillin-N epimerase